MRSGRFSLRLFYVGAALVLFWLQESCCYVAILSMRALRPRFHATSSFFLNRRFLSKLLLPVALKNFGSNDVISKTANSDNFLGNMQLKLSLYDWSILIPSSKNMSDANHLRGTLRKHKFISTGSKGHGF